MSPHGTYSRYTNSKCRCVPCTRANTVYHEKYEMNGSKEWGHLPSVRAHLRFLLDPSRPKDRRFSIRGLARHLDMNFQGLRKIYAGETRRVTRFCADKIMATSLYDLDSTICWRPADSTSDNTLAAT